MLPKKQLLRLAAIVTCSTLVLSACGGSSGEDDAPDGSIPDNGDSIPDNGDDGTNGDDDVTDNGDDGTDNGDDDDNGGTGSDSGLAQADRLLIYEGVSGGTQTRWISAIDIDDGTNREGVSPNAQDNMFARDEGWFWPMGSRALSVPDNTNLPLSVLQGDWTDGTLSNAQPAYALYNTADGELYRLDTRGGAPEAVRFSAEADADVICASAVAPDYANPENSRLIYQVANDSSCTQTEIRMARVGADDDEAVVTLSTDVAAEDSFQQQDHDWSGWLHDGSGALTEVITYDGGSIRAYDLAADEETVLSSNDDEIHFRHLGWTGNGETLIFAGEDFALHAYRGDGQVDDLQSSVFQLVSQEHAVNVEGRLYVVDPESQFSGTGRVIEIDPDSPTPVEELDSGWSSAGEPLGVTVGNGYIAWAYGRDNDWHIRHAALDGSSADDLATLASGDFPVVSPAAPGDGNSRWFLYDDTSGDDPVARGIEFTGGGGTFEVPDSRWVGQTWSSTVIPAGYQAEYLAYWQEDGDNGGALHARPAAAIASSAQDVDLELDESLSTGFWVDGIGPKTLMAAREGVTATTNRPQAVYVDLSQAGSAVKLTEGSEDDRPIPGY